MKGIFGAFENPDDINKYWYQVTEEELENSIEQVKRDLEHPDNEKDTIKILQQDLEGTTEELKDLQDFVDAYARCIERYKHDKKALQQIQDDWSNYNASLYAQWSRLQSFILDGAKRPNNEELKANREWYKSERIKREEIKRRIKKLLSE